ncbi:MAG: fibronectin type III domain-containing protein [Thaumarchaeota archaeon]|nr:fibronectin type III domain-containing protein [Nitrososphaerota archaeon]
MNTNQNYDKVLDVYGKVKNELIKRKNVFGVGHGFKEIEGKLTDKPAIIVYVKEKLNKEKISQDELIPKEIDGIQTDVVEISHHRHGEGERAQDEHDHGFLDYSKIHEDNLGTMNSPNPDTSNDVDMDNIAIIEDDPASSFVIESRKDIDWVHAYNKFRMTHPDVYDFVTFWATSDIDIECACGAFYCGLANSAQGVGWNRCWPGGRSGWNTNKLEAFHFFKRTDDAPLLQETGHHWGAFAGFKENASDPQIRYDHMLNNRPGHWNRYMDDDNSPMDYDDIDWIENNDGTFTKHPISQGEFVFCDLDLYLMGLIPPSQVNPFYYIKNPTGTGNTISGQKKQVSIDQIILANGQRTPDSSSSQKTFKQAWIILTKDVSKVNVMARDRERLRKKYTKIFYHATKYLAKVDTTLSDSTELPEITNVSWQRNGASVTINWDTNVPCKSIVNYSENKDDLLQNRFKHSIQYQTVTDDNLNINQVTINGLDSQKVYHFEVMAETIDGLLDRNSNNDALFTIDLSVSPPPDPPIDFKGTGISTSEIKLRWSQPTITGGTPITNYEIKRRKTGSGGGWFTLPSIAGTKTTVTDDSGLIKNTLYDYEIRAKNSHGISDASTTQAQTGKCFILTAAFGSDLAPKAQLVHEFIDDVVLESRFHKPFEDFLKLYFKFSPPIANLMDRNKAFKYIVKYSVAYPYVVFARATAFVVKPFVKHYSYSEKDN